MAAVCRDSATVKARHCSGGLLSHGHGQRRSMQHQRRREYDSCIQCFLHRDKLLAACVEIAGLLSRPLMFASLTPLT